MINLKIYFRINYKDDFLIVIRISESREAQMLNGYSSAFYRYSIMNFNLVRDSPQIGEKFTNQKRVLI